MFTRKQFISAFLAVVMLMGMILPVHVSASEDVTTPASTAETVSAEETAETSAEEEAVPIETAAETVATEAAPPTEETVEATEETTTETAAPTVETVPVTEETAAPTEETVAETIPEETVLAEDVIAEDAENAVALEDAAGAVTCVIDSGDKSKVAVSVQVASGVPTDDAMLYLFALPTYVDSVSGQTPVASVQYGEGGTYSFSVDLNNNTEASLLYSKFCVAVKTSGAYAAITNGNYITNPEAIASSRAARTKINSKKGIQIDFLMGTDLEDLGIDNCSFGITYQKLLSNTKTDYPYTYNGKTYYINPVIEEYDFLIRNMTKTGSVVTVVLLNEYRAGYEYLIPEGVSQRSGTVNYAVNTSTQQSLEAVAAATHFLAERYSGGSYGKVENWIFGNEVNDNFMYYYMGEQDADTFVREYLQSFRVAYTAIKSAYSNANVYFCLEHCWNTQDTTKAYAGKGFVERFNAYTKAQGDMDWGLAYHAYSYPLNDPDILNDGAPTMNENGVFTGDGEVTNSPDSLIITMKNIGQLTQYFHREHLLNSSGQVRSIILSEQGYTSYSNVTGQDEKRQAANIALAYYIAEMNSDIDAFILRTHTDEDEGSPYYKFGLRNASANGSAGDTKYAYWMYKHIDTTQSLEYTQFAKSILNIGDWSEVVPGWNAKKFASMGTHSDTGLYTVTGSTKTTDIVSTMLNQWEVGYNVFSIGGNDYDGKPYPGGVAVANLYAYYLAFQGIEKNFSTPLDLSGSPYLTLDVNFKPMDASGTSDKLELKIRLHSGNDVYDAIGIVDVNKDYTVCLDLNDWAGRNSIDAMEVLIREYGQQKSYSGTFTVYNVKSAADVSGMQILEAPDYPGCEDYGGTPGGSGGGSTGDSSGGSTGGSTGGSSDDETVIPEDAETIPMYRLYNPNSGEHFYTGSLTERQNLVKAGWNYEGIAWNAPIKDGAPVYRVFNPNSGDHHYTMSWEEVEMLTGLGWKYEGVSWNSASASNVPQYRLYNPNADCGSHHYTSSTEERDYLVSLGWIFEGIGWYGIA